MALKKTTALDEDATPTGDHYIATVQDPTGAAKSVRSSQDQIVGYKVTTAGDTQYATGSRALARLPIGTAGQVLTTNAGATAPEWKAGGIGTHSKYIAVGEGGDQFKPMTSSGSGAIQKIEINAIDVDIIANPFDPDVSEYSFCQIAMPKGWDKGSVTAKIYWTANSTNTGGVRWILYGLPFADGDSLNQGPLTINGPVTDAHNGTAYDLNISAETSSVAISAATENELVTLRLRRVGTDGADTFTADAFLIGVLLLFTRDAANDD